MARRGAPPAESMLVARVAVVLELQPLVFVRRLGSGTSYAFALAEPDAVARGETADEAVETLRRYLSRKLSKAPADTLAAYVYPTDAELLEVPVVLDRPDLPRRIAITSAVTVPCITIPDRDDRWVWVVPMRHAVHLHDVQGDLARRLAADIARVVAASEPTADELATLLPARRHEVRRITVEIERDDAGDLGKRAADRRKRQGDKARDDARKLLDTIGRDLLGGKRKRAPVTDRDREVRTLGALLSGDRRLSVVIVGPGSAGKTAVLDGLLGQDIVPFRSRPVFGTSGAQLVAGQSGFGQLEERVHEVMRAVELLDAVLWFDDFSDLFAGHAGGIEDMASAMRPWVVDGRVRIVGELTPEQLEHLEKHHVGFFSAIQRVTVEPLSPESTRRVLEDRIAHEERHQPTRPSLAREAIDPLVQLADRYLGYEAFPGKAVRLVDELRAIHEGEVDEAGRPVRIGSAEVYRAFAIRSGIPTFLLRRDHAMRHDEVAAFFRKRVIGQAEAIDRVAETLCTVKAGLQPPSKPLATFLFIGPTGVGKTEVAKTLARFLFGSQSRLLRYDMSEYMDALAAERLIRGTQRDEGELTRRVRQQPFCVVLLDEIEKAHPAVFDLLLQVCGEGRLSDARGRTTWFHNAIVIMTSNLGAAHRRPRAGFGADSAQADARYFVEQVERHFRPEFVNRLDRVIPFSALDRDEIRHVARVALARLSERDAIAARGLDLRVSDAALEHLAAAGYSEAYGARALRRHLEDALVAPVAALVCRLGRDAPGARVRVALPHEDLAVLDREGADPGVALVDERVGPLRIAIHRRAGEDRRLAASHLDSIAYLRRTARRALPLQPLPRMRERLDYLVSELAAAGARPERLVDLMRGSTEQVRLRRLLGAVDEEVAAIEGAEDLAIGAALEGEDPAPLVAEAEAAYERFEVAWVRAVLGASPIDRLVVIARPLGGAASARRISDWLHGWLGVAAERGWDAIVHRFEDREPDPPWPTGHPWGPPRTAAWITERLADATDDDLARDFRAVVLRLRGEQAGAVMHQELGLHRFGARGEHTHLQIRFAHAEFDVQADTLHGGAFVLPSPPERDALDKMDAVRVFTPEGNLLLPTVSQELRVDAASYFRLHDRVLFSLLAGGLADGRGVLPEDGGDEWS
jgi:ATP-dependent Clp protease ATP-binding subunit ClpC